MTYKTETIGLKRIEKKLWQYKDFTPKRVELAVLDYLKDLGWRGYFTEHFDYEHTLLCMMCWCNRASYFSEKRKSLAIKNIRYAFTFAKDGYWLAESHKLSHQDLMNNAKSFSEAAIPKILDVWKARGVKSFIVGSAYLNPRSADELAADDLISFFRAKGGLDYFIAWLEYHFPVAKQELMYRAQKNFAAILEEKGPFSDDAILGLSRDSGAYLGVFQSAKKMLSVDDWISEIAAQPQTPLAAELLQLAKDIKDFASRYAVESDDFDDWAKLDLTLWKEALAYVEVKAPGDRLMAHQKALLERDSASGRMSWVINVVEA